MNIRDVMAGSKPEDAQPKDATAAGVLAMPKQVIYETAASMVPNTERQPMALVIVPSACLK